MHKILKACLALGLGLSLSGAAFAAEEGGHEGATPHYPLIKPEELNWSFEGPFGTYDKGQLQRGLKVFRESCAACHSMNLVAFRSLQDLGYSDAQVRTLAAEYTIQDGPDAAGDMFERAGIPSDYFPAPFANEEQAAASNNGAAPPDLSLIAKARGVERGFPRFVFDVFTQYAEGGPDYVYSLLTGYGESSDAHHMSSPHPEGHGARLAMAAALDRAGLESGQIDYINLHGTATPSNDSAEGRAVADLFGRRVPAGRPKASQPIGCSTLWPVMRL